jgi:ABC-type antimicrobial peptide transport system permease subunit
MFSNYFLNAYRSLVKQKAYTIINISGFAISIAACLFLYSVIRFELSFDVFHERTHSIYRVVTETVLEEDLAYSSGVPGELPDAFRSDFPDLLTATIAMTAGMQVDVPNAGGSSETSKFKEDVFYAEKQFFEIFNFQWLHGSPEILSQPNKVALTREVAQRYFGSWQSAIGQRLVIGGKALEVEGILTSMPPNTDFPLGIVVSFITQGPPNKNWGFIASRLNCYIVLRAEMNAAQLQEQLPAFKTKYNTNIGNTDRYVLQPFTEIHFDARFGNHNRRTVNRDTLYTLILVGIFLIATACINFVNLSVAQGMKRAKEVGVRKALGSSQRQLAALFFGETLLILCLASVIAVGIFLLALPQLRSTLNFPPGYFPIGISELTILLSVLIVVVAATTGTYPAVVISGFKPTEALKSKLLTAQTGGLPVRKALVIVQFFIGQVLIIGTMIAMQQTRFLNDQSPGFDKNSVLIVNLPMDTSSRKKYETFKSEVKKLATIEQASFSFAPPASNRNRVARFKFENSQSDGPLEANIKYADPEFFEMYDIQLVAGKLYQQSDTVREYIVSENLLKMVGISDPDQGIGRNITLNEKTFPISGVIRDFHTRSFRTEKEPLLIFPSKSDYRCLNVKLGSKNVTETLSNISALYRTHFPDNIFDYQFLEENIAGFYIQEERLGKLTKIFSAISIFVSCLGLYGLVSFIAVQRLKEIGLRKVLGASVFNIVGRFCKEFLILVGIAFIIAAPVGLYVMTAWLSGFAYRIEVGPFAPLMALTLVAVMATLTVSLECLKAARMNPVKTLRSE